MSVEKLKVLKLLPEAELPTYGTPEAAGLDLYAAEDVTIVPGQTVKVRTGLAFEIPAGYYGALHPLRHLHQRAADAGKRRGCDRQRLPRRVNDSSVQSAKLHHHARGIGR